MVDTRMSKWMTKNKNSLKACSGGFWKRTIGPFQDNTQCTPKKRPFGFSKVCQDWRMI